MEFLQCGAQTYAWGKPAASSRVAALLRSRDATVTIDDNARYAELWMGVHKNQPSLIANTPTSGSDTEKELLSDFLAKNAETFHSKHHTTCFQSTSLPFLLKVLSIDKALSIQAHPTRALAKVLHAKDSKNYPDPNHKPELIVALTRFEALCCFRHIAETDHFIQGSPALQGLLGDEAVQAIHRAASSQHGGAASTPETKAALKLALQQLYSHGKDVVETAVAQHIQHINDKMRAFSPNGAGNTELNRAHEVFIRTNQDFPGDVGLWMVYFLNYVVLSPGEGLFLAAMEPHAYLSGDGVEIMANSDNVVRAGLTPKFKDVETLLEMLSYETNALEKAHYKVIDSQATQLYAPPSWCEDFGLIAVRLHRASGRTSAKVNLPCIGLGLCVEGSALIAVRADKDDQRLAGEGAVFILSKGEITFSLSDGENSAVLFIGTTNDPADKVVGKSAL